MMKRIAIFMIATVCVCVFITGCGKDEERKQAVRVHDYYKISADGEEDIAALFYLGTEKKEIKKTAEELLNTYNIPLEKALDIEYEEVKTDNGREWYLIVPKYEGTTIQVHSVRLNDQGSLEEDKELTTTDKPVILCCNESDIVPSAQVTVTFKDRKAVFNPSISLKDGKVTENEGVFTK